MKEKLTILDYIILLFKGALVGFAASLPGISGGSLCAAFGMYRPIMSLFSHPIKTLKESWLSLCIFAAGGAIGFVALAKLFTVLFGVNEVAVICVILGFVIATLPELWKSAAREKRTRASYPTLGISFFVLLAGLILLKYFNVTLLPNFFTFILCGFLFCMSFVVPGLSSSNIIMFFGLYDVMEEGIGNLDFHVLLPMAIGAVLCILTLTQLVNLLLEKFTSPFMFAIFGFVLASTIMIVPMEIFKDIPTFLLHLLLIAAGFAVSFLASIGCAYIDKKTKQNEAAKVEDTPSSEN